MKSNLLALRRKLDTMYKNQAPIHLVNEVRETEISKLLKTRTLDIETRIKSLQESRQEIIDAATYKPKDDTEALARRLRMESEFASMSKSALLKYRTDDPESLTMQAATLRKRGLHEDADMVYNQIEIARTAPYRDPLVKACETEITRYGMLLPHEDRHQLWIGGDFQNIKPDDFAQITPDKKLRFKDNDGKEIEV